LKAIFNHQKENKMKKATAKTSLPELVQLTFCQNLADASLALKLLQIHTKIL